MLDDNEIKKIQDLIKQGLSNYKIGKKLNHSANTIKPIREKMEKNQTREDDIQDINPIDRTRKIEADIENLIQKEELTDRDRKIWEKRLEKLKQILQTVVEDRIPSERADAIEKRDQEWNKSIKQNFVPKEVVTNLGNISKEKDKTITRLEKEIEGKDILLSRNQIQIQKDQDTIIDQRTQIRNLTINNNILTQANNNLHNYIKNQLENAIQQPQEQLQHAQVEFTDEKINFIRFKDKQQLTLDKMFFEVQERTKANDVREKHLNDREEKIRKREEEFDTYKNHCYNEISEIINAIKIRVEDIALDHCKKLVKKEFEKQFNEIVEEWKKIEEAKEQIKKHQKPCSGEPSIQ